jgi:L-threonylcarbamoyladenylate synthase
VSRGPIPVVEAEAPDAVDLAERALGEGVVALPTDTVYGLAARLDRRGALRAVFELKGRPKDLALPVLLADPEQLGAVVAAWPDPAALLAERCWPGPLTVVVPGWPQVAAAVGAAATVGVRVPDHPFVRRLCRRVGPLAVTSANRHGQAPATSAAQVVRGFPPEERPAGGASLRLVIDGGASAGVPSTVVEVGPGGLQVLREGAVPRQLLEALVVSRAAGGGLRQAPDAGP